MRLEDVDGCSSCIRTEQDDALELGDVAWHDGFILHSAGSNQGQQVRNGLAISFFEARCGKISVTCNVQLCAYVPASFPCSAALRAHDRTLKIVKDAKSSVQIHRSPSIV